MMVTESKGFSIVEILIGVAVFMIGMMGVAMLHITVIKGNAFSGNYTEATALAQDTLENLLNKDWWDDELTDTDGNGAFGITPTCSLAAVPDQPTATPLGIGTNNRYLVWWNVADDDVISQTKTVQVCVQWVVKGEEYSIGLTRLIPRR